MLCTADAVTESRDFSAPSLFALRSLMTCCLDGMQIQRQHYSVKVERCLETPLPVMSDDRGMRNFRIRSYVNKTVASTKIKKLRNAVSVRQFLIKRIRWKLPKHPVES